MKCNHIFLVMLYFLCFACQEKIDTAKHVLNPNEEFKDSTLNFILKKFSLPYTESLNLDSNTLVFYGTRSFDTSFLIHLKQSNSEIRGVYYEILPTYHNNVNDFSIETNQLLYFEGYSFILDSTKWKIIKSKAEKLLLDDVPFEVNYGCRDCKNYFLAFNFKKNINNDEDYERFYGVLKELLLEKFIQKRKPIMYKVK